MKRITFSNFKAALAAMLTRGTNFNPLERLFAGHVLTRGQDFVGPFDIRVWLQEYLGWSGFERAPKRDERGGYQRRAKTTKTVRGINYRKQNNRVDRALRKLFGLRAYQRAYPETVLRIGVRRDALTGVVA